MAYNVKNYTEQGGEKTVIGGTLEIATGGSVTGLDATAAKKGLVKRAANVALAAGSAPTKAEFDALIAALIASGAMAAAT
jgi:hypothetical protein